ncbi:MAG: hypothetical protein Q8Q73_19190 [Stagnimonas sp.]|nr:hypothetical protein [Stagnimonas sp.]
MHAKLQPLLISVAAALLLSACASGREVDEQLAFSESLIRDYGLAEPHKRRLQYYVSEPITLARSASSSMRGIADGRLVDRGARDIDKLHVASGTPGVVVGSGPNWLAVSFEPGSYLYFVSKQPRLNSPYWDDRRDGDRYYLYAPDWDGRAGTVQVGNASYQALGRSIDAFLLVDRDSLYTTDSRDRVLSGRLLDRDSR